MSKFSDFSKVVDKQITLMVKDDKPLFLTDVSRDELWDTYLSSFPEGTNPIYIERTEHDCQCCRQFIRPLGNVVSIVDNKLVSIWDVEGANYPYDVVAKTMSDFVKSKTIVNVFLTDDLQIGTDKSRQLLENGDIKIWEHFSYKLPNAYKTPRGKSVEAVQGTIRDSKNVFKRSMDELSIEAGKTILDLIDQGSLYRGEEHKKAVESFIMYKTEYNEILDEDKENWTWLNSRENPVSRIRNSAIGTLLTNLSDEMDLDEAVTKFEKMVAPENYKRPKAIFTKKMVEQAEAKIVELGFENSLTRKHAVLEDITINNVLFADRDVKATLKDASPFDSLKDEVSDNSKSFDRVEEIGIEDFVKDVLPNVTNMEVMMENTHQNNLMSLVAPLDKNSPSMLKWSNNFSWAYNGDVTDSLIKKNVKSAGGDVDGVLRFSIQWNDNNDNRNDFDAHCIEPNGNEIYFSSPLSRTGGNLDIDITAPDGVAVENITWPDLDRMLNGQYKFFVNNYAHRGGKSGFTAEIEYNGQIYSYVYDKELRSKEKVEVALIDFNRKTGIKFIRSLDSTTSSKEVWGVKTNKFSKVSVFMFSPNYWDGQKGIGNKHYFFFLENAKNENAPRGFYNEFLNDKLMEHKRVFEALGSKMRVEPSSEQLTGLGFSSTNRNSLVVKVGGSFNRVLKIKF